MVERQSLRGSLKPSCRCRPLQLLSLLDPRPCSHRQARYSRLCHHQRRQYRRQQPLLSHLDLPRPSSRRQLRHRLECRQRRRRHRRQQPLLSRLDLPSPSRRHWLRHRRERNQRSRRYLQDHRHPRPQYKRRHPRQLLLRCRPSVPRPSSLRACLNLLLNQRRPQEGHLQLRCTKPAFRQIERWILL